MPFANARGEKYHRLPDPVFLDVMYNDMEYSTLEIAHVYSVTKAAVRAKMKRNGMQLRQTSGRKAVPIQLHAMLAHFLEGLILGDGCITRHSRGSAYYRHVDKHLCYICWLKYQLDELGLPTGPIHRNKNTGCFGIASVCSPGLYPLYHRWYWRGRKLIPPRFRLSPVKLFNWYIGDGQYWNNGRSKKGEQLRLWKISDPKGRERLTQRLEELGIYNTADNKGIYIKAQSRQTFFDYIHKHRYSVPLCYEYKFPEVYNACKRN